MQVNGLLGAAAGVALAGAVYCVADEDNCAGEADSVTDAADQFY